MKNAVDFHFEFGKWISFHRVSAFSTPPSPSKIVLFFIRIEFVLEWLAHHPARRLKWMSCLVRDYLRSLRRRKWKAIYVAFAMLNCHLNSGISARSNNYNDAKCCLRVCRKWEEVGDEFMYMIVRCILLCRTTIWQLFLRHEEFSK